MKKMTVNYDEIYYKKVGSLRVKNKEERNVIDFFFRIKGEANEELSEKSVQNTYVFVKINCV